MPLTTRAKGRTENGQGRGQAVCRREKGNPKKSHGEDGTRSSGKGNRIRRRRGIS